MGSRLQKAEFDSLTKGPRNAHKAYHLGGDGDVKRIGLDAEETQLIEAHQFLVEEICRWFGVQVLTAAQGHAPVAGDVRHDCDVGSVA
jgi:phage portal protein BeeE